MIKAKPKPLEEIIDNVKDFQRLLIAGCDGCVTVCEAGGLKEVKILAAALRLGVRALMVTQNKTLTERDLEVAVLDRTKERRKFRRIPAEVLHTLLPETS